MDCEKYLRVQTFMKLKLHKEVWSPSLRNRVTLKNALPIPSRYWTLCSLQVQSVAFSKAVKYSSIFVGSGATISPVWSLTKEDVDAWKIIGWFGTICRIFCTTHYSAAFLYEFLRRCLRVMKAWDVQHECWMCSGQVVLSGRMLRRSGTLV